MWYQVELPQPVTIAELIVDSSVGGRIGFGGTGPGGQMPAFAMAGYRVQVSMDGQTWSDPVAQGQGNPLNSSTMISMTPVRAKFFRITQTGAPQFKIGWAIQRIRVFALQ
jgi:hypothetical protein